MPDRHLEREGIDPALVHHDGAKIFLSQARRFMTEAERRDELPTLGLLDGDDFSLGDLGPMGPLLQQAVSLRDAIEVFARLVAAYADSNSIVLTAGPNQAFLSCRTEGLSRTEHVADHHTLLYLREVVRLAAGRDWQPERVLCYSSRSNAFSLVDDSRDWQVRFHQSETGLLIPTELLATPILAVDGNNSLVGGSAPLSPPPVSMGAALEQVLGSYLESGRMPSSRETADMLRVSRSSFYRGLSAEGVTYQRIADRVRIRRARDLLANEGIRIKTVGFELGYANTANFVNAFRRMAGCTPGEFRRRLQTGS